MTSCGQATATPVGRLFKVTHQGAARERSLLCTIALLVCIVKNEYMSLVEQCMVFACELMDLCRGTQEVEAVLQRYGLLPSYFRH